MTLRRRLTIAFALAVGVTAGTLAAGSYFVVRHTLLRDSVHPSAKQARQTLRLAPTDLPGRPDKLLADYKAAGGFETVLVSGGRTYSTKFLSLGQVPSKLRALVRRGQL